MSSNSLHKEQPTMITNLKRLIAAALILALTLMATLVTPATASANELELVAPADEPALCGSAVANLIDYNDTLIFSCVVATNANTFIFTDLTTNTDVRCHVDISPARLQGIREVGEEDWFPFGVADFCLPLLDIPVPTPTPTPTPLACADGLVAVLDAGAAKCVPPNPANPTCVAGKILVVNAGVGACVDEVTRAPALAFTGTSSTLGYVGAGMIALGAVALGARRRIDQ